jgi:hypothetical protein
MEMVGPDKKEIVVPNKKEIAVPNQMEISVTQTPETRRQDKDTDTTNKMG